MHPKATALRPRQNQPPRNEIEDMMRKGQEQLRVLIGGKSTGSSGGGGGNDSPSMPSIGRSGGLLFLVALVILWLFVSFYRVETSEQSVELFFGKYYKTGEEGFEFRPMACRKQGNLPRNPRKHRGHRRWRGQSLGRGIDAHGR